MLAQASISVPSTEKCSLDKSLRTSGKFNTPAMNLAATSPPRRRSRFLQKTYGIIRRKAHKPAEQKIMVELLYEQPFGAHAVESLEKQSTQKPLGGDARPAVPRVKLGQRPRLTGEHLINQHAADDP